MPDTIIETLSAEERADLKLCGITTEEQLLESSPSTLWRDLEQARAFFPDHNFALTQKRLAELCGEDEDTEEEDTPQTPDIPGLNEGQPATPTVQFKHKKNLKKELLRAQEREEERQRRSSEMGAMSKLERMHGLSKHFHAVRCSHPHRVLFGAWATLLLIVPFCGLVLIPFMLLTGDIDKMQPITFGAAFAATVLPWFFIARTAECGVCHMRIFSFKHYGHHRTAHHIPLIGYTIATALHIIALFWFRCPACGTQMKLFGGSRRHHHHH